MKLTANVLSIDEDGGNGTLASLVSEVGLPVGSYVVGRNKSASVWDWREESRIQGEAQGEERTILLLIQLADVVLLAERLEKGLGLLACVATAELVRVAERALRDHSQYGQ